MDLSNDVVIHQKVNDIEFLQFRKLLEYPQVAHAYGLKELNFRKTDGEDIRFKSYEKLLGAIHVPMSTLVKPNQEHTDHILKIDEKVNFNQPDMDLDYLNAIDGTMTSKKGITLASTNADCQLLLFYDTKNSIIANVHAGWRGTFQKIAKKMVIKMKEEYGSHPKDIIVAFCPSIRACHFEVDTDVKEECERIFEYTSQLSSIIQQGRVWEGKQKYNIDTILINKILLKEEGILEENMLDSGICSVCQKEKVHSRRVEGPLFGVGSAVITLLD